MSRRKRTQLLDDAEAIVAWAGVGAAVVAFTMWQPAVVVLVAALALQAVRGRLR